MAMELGITPTKMTTMMVSLTKSTRFQKTVQSLLTLTTTALATMPTKMMTVTEFQTIATYSQLTVANGRQ